MVGIIILIVAFVLVMVVSTGVMVDVLEEWVKGIRNRRMFLSSMLLAVAAAAPEIALAIAASIEGKPLVALGNAIGANLANLGLVVGGLVALVGVIPVVGEYVSSSLWVTISLAILPFMLMTDGNLSRFDGAALLFGYLLYLNYLIKSNWIELKQVKALKRKPNRDKDVIPMKWASVTMFIIGSAILIICAIFLVKLVSVAAVSLGVSTFWIGLVFLSIVTTLPELLVGWWNHKKKESLLTVEKLLGSIVTNSTLVIGLLAIISPMEVQDTMSKGLSGLFLVFILGLFWLFTKSKKKIERWEGIVLMGVYLMFLGLQMLIVR